MKYLAHEIFEYIFNKYLLPCLSSYHMKINIIHSRCIFILVITYIKYFI